MKKSVLLALFLVCCAELFAGISVPGPAGKYNVYYWVKGAQLNRALCDHEIIPSEDNCTEDVRSVPYKPFDKALQGMISVEQKALDIESVKLSSTLIEQDPGVIKQREAIRNIESQIVYAEEQGKAVQESLAVVAKSLKVAEKQLDAINRRLASPSLPAGERDRLTEIQREYIGQKSLLTQRTESLKVEYDNFFKKAEQAKQQLVSTRNALNAYLSSLQVDSSELRVLRDKRNNLNAQSRLWPEGKSRLEDLLAYPLHTWKAEGAKGLVSRFDTLFVVAPDTDGPTQSTLVALTEANFSDEVLKQKRPVLVAFWAPWSPPSMAMKSTFDDLAADYEGIATVGKVNVDEQEKLSVKYGAESIPLILVFKNGKVVDKLLGAGPKSALEAMINESLVLKR